MLVPIGCCYALCSCELCDGRGIPPFLMYHLCAAWCCSCLLCAGTAIKGDLSCVLDCRPSIQSCKAYSGSPSPQRRGKARTSPPQVSGHWSSTGPFQTLWLNMSQLCSPFQMRLSFLQKSQPSVSPEHRLQMQRPPQVQQFHCRENMQMFSGSQPLLRGSLHPPSRRARLTQVAAAT